MPPEKTELKEIISGIYEKAFRIEDNLDSLNYFRENFDSLERAGYDLREQKENSFNLVMGRVLEEGYKIKNHAKALNTIKYNLERIEKSGYDVSFYKGIYFDLFESYSNTNLN